MAIYMKIEGIDGDATHLGHEKWIVVESFGWGMGRGISTPSGSTKNREASEPSISEITITKSMDSASSKIFTEAATGTKGKKVEFHFVSTGSPGATYIEYELTDALISGYSLASGGDRPLESMTINFTKIQYKFVPLKENNEAGTPVTVSYDLSTTKSG